MARKVLLKDVRAVLALYLAVDREDVVLTPVPSAGPHVVPDYTLADSFNRCVPLSHTFYFFLLMNFINFICRIRDSPSLEPARPSLCHTAAFTY
jgi:hypothetical protein